VTPTPAAKTCPTCGQERSSGEYYANRAECMPCKKERSKQNRLLVARKIAFAERVLDMLADLVNRGWQPELCEHTTANRAAHQEVRP